ncbi:MAG: hypothetical protein RIM84_11380 [Alphaproteobacteria bacterium]
MSNDTQFWLNWAVLALAAFGTISAVVVALFGNWFRASLAPPKLNLALKSERGDKTPATIKSPDGSASTLIGRWYHLEVSNHRRWSPATQVQVFLLRVEERDATGEHKVTWVGEVPLRWKYQGMNPLLRTIGHSVDCDLCSVVKDKWVSLEVLISPSALETVRPGATDIIVTVQARSIEVDSQMLRIRIAWDGKWSDDADDMAQHMVVREIEEP